MLTEEDALQKHITVEAAYQLIKYATEIDDATEMYLGLQYQIAATNIPLIYQMYDSINFRKFEGASALFETFSPEDESEINIHLLLNIYLSSLNEAGRYVLSAEDSTSILEIAKQPVQLAGTGVYMARAMLDTTFEFSISEDGEFFKASQNKKISIYPNPANTFITVSSSLESDAHNIVKIFNAAGEKIKQEEIISSLQIITIKDLAEGIYYLEIKNESGEILTSEKFIKQ